jgi:putative lysine transport system substrate-binding protein
MAAVVAYPDLKMLDFTGTSDNYAVDEGDVNIGVSIAKGNSGLVDACNSVLSGMTADDFTALMKTAISIQPLNG